MMVSPAKRDFAAQVSWGLIDIDVQVIHLDLIDTTYEIGLFAIIEAKR